MSSLRFHPIELSKEEYANVASIVFKNTTSVATNLIMLKKWADRHEDDVKSIAPRCQELESRVDELASAAQGAQRQLGDLDSQMQAMLGQQAAQANALTVSVWQLLSAMNTMLTLFGNSFQVQELAEMPPTVSASTASPDCEGGSPAEERGGTVGLEALQALGGAVERQLSHLGSAFDNWDRFRDMMEQKQQDLQSSVAAVTRASDSMREDLREEIQVVEQHAGSIRDLASAVKLAQAGVDELREVQVVRENVEEIVGRTSQHLENMLSGTETRLQSVSKQVEARVGDMRKAVRELRQQTDERIEEHSSKVAVIMDKILAPVNGYLNTMHVKVAENRSDLDVVRGQVSGLQASVASVSSDLEHRDGQGRERAAELGGHVEDLRRLLAEGAARGEDQNTSLTESIQALSRRLSETTAAVQNSLSDTAQAVDVMKEEQEVSDLARDMAALRVCRKSAVGPKVSALARDLAALERKVAKWVQAEALPAKVGEARLYALEARLKEETNARLELEMAVRDKAVGGQPRAPGKLEPCPPKAHGKFELPQLQEASAGSAIGLPCRGRSKNRLAY